MKRTELGWKLCPNGERIFGGYGGEFLSGTFLQATEREFSSFFFFLEVAARYIKAVRVVTKVCIELCCCVVSAAANSERFEFATKSVMQTSLSPATSFHF